MQQQRSMLSYREFGNVKGSKIIVLLAGFPDNETSGWGDVLEHFKTSPKFKDYRLICCCLPDMEDHPSVPRKPWGYSMDEMVALLAATVDHLVPNKQTKVTLCIHDWGAHVGMLFENAHTSRVEQILCFDVASGVSKGKSNFFLGPFFLVLLYQLWWASAYIVSQLIHHSIGNAIFLSYSIFVPAFLRPTRPEKLPRPLKDINVSMCYPYYSFWKQALTTDRKKLAPKRLSCRVLFLYGVDKNVMFHNNKFLSDIDSRTDGSKYLALDAGHWMTRGDPSKICIHAIEEFLFKK